MAKNYKVKDIVVNLNNSLIDLEKGIIAGNENLSIPPIFIIGAPRSGTTLVNQIVASAFNIAYIDNISSKFWEAPSVGLSLSNQIAPFKKRKLGSFTSSFGFTEEAIGPHEFGYFWQKWFNFDVLHELTKEQLNKINKQDLKNQVHAMCSSVKLPVLFKNTVSLTFQIDYLYELFPNALFIFCFREPLYNAQSLAQSRIKYYGTMEEWFSVKPLNYKKMKTKKVAEQVVYQLYSCNQRIEKLLNKLKKKQTKQYTVINYIELCHNPNQIIRNIANMFDQSEVKIQPKKFSLNPLYSTNRQKTDNDFFNELLKYTKKYFK